MRNKFFTSLLLLSVVLASASAKSNRLGVWDSENRHSASFSVGFYPVMSGYYTSQLSRTREFSMAESNPNYYDYYSDSCFSMPALSASYFYRVGRLFSVGLSVGYGYEATKLYADVDDKYAFTTHDHVLLATPTLRLHWLNTSRLEMYSGVGVLGYGLAISKNGERVEGQQSRTEGLAMQFTPIAASVKLDRMYIFSELGVGTYGLLRVGAGYRF